MTNSRGSYRTTLANVFAAYDKLPKPVREALANAEFDFVPQPIATYLARGASPAQAIAAIRKNARDKIAADRLKVWGIGVSLEDLGL